MSGNRDGGEREKRLLVKDQNSGTKARKARSCLHPNSRSKADEKERKANYREVKYRSAKKKKGIRTIESTCHQINKALQSSKWLSSGVSERNIFMNANKYAAKTQIKCYSREAIF